MKISANGHEYTVRFHHKEMEGRRITECLISAEPDQLFGGYAFCSRQDDFNKATGRKISLTRALASLPKSQRAAIWAAIQIEREKINAKPWTV